MLAFAALCFSFLFSAVVGFPLVKRDVVAPHITNPHEGTIWVVGSRESVTWETDDLPPASQITNLMGRVILGFQANDSLNLDLDHPLAENFKITTGNITITVPDVPSRDDYIIVLMGDSGNASPAFAITSIRGGSGSSSGSASGTSTPTSSSATDNSPPVTGNTITGSASTRTSGTTQSGTTPVPTPTSPVSLPSSVTASVSPSGASSEPATVVGSAAGAATSTNAAWSVYNCRLWFVIAAPLALAFLL
ncbi:hypothetical protein D9756_004652 [Leucocoprinus leucothites]|uniref:Uncharacterized protein n=1 Tax=Leucocoprinus leucothites TaxID=201217 RepID=A0A8H5LKS2_9AGAR|nr:hypothetical protein D9756_004652 [Leucoagaricus leucothites]